MRALPLLGWVERWSPLGAPQIEKYLRSPKTTSEVSQGLMAGTGWSPIRMDLRDDGLIDISSFLEESISPILERPTKRHATAVPALVI